MIKQKKFCKACETFTRAMNNAADWKNNYFGAVYSTRLYRAIEDVRKACDEMEKILEEDKII